MIARFVRGSTRFDIASAPFAVGDDFLPPATAMEYNIASGTSANRYGGGTLINEKAANVEWSFGVRLIGPSNSTASYMETQARRLVAFLKSSSNDALYFEFLPFDLPEPLWGQGLSRYEIVTADADIVGEQYQDLTLRAKGMYIQIRMTIKPYRMGVKQRLASALGGVSLDVVGNADGMPVGLMIEEAGTNKMTNPIFGSATWSTGWTAAANIVAERETDLRYCFPGATSAARLTSVAGSSNTFTQSINVGNTNKHSFSAYVRRPDGAAVTSADCQIYYGSAQTTTFTSLGDGWYWAKAENITGVNAGTATGLVIPAGRSVILSIMDCKERTTADHPTHGDGLGCSWSGTAHASTSVRAAGRVMLTANSSTFNLSQGAIAISWKAEFASTVAGDRYFFSCGATSLRAYFNATSDVITFTDNTNTISSSSQTFSAGDTLNLLFVWGPSGIAIYKNGASLQSSGTYTPPALPSYVYIGTDATPANYADGWFRDFRVYGTELTSTQAAALNTAITPITSTSIRPGDIPWLWTKDGDDIVDNHSDSGHNNWCMCAGVPGDAPALTCITIHHSSAATLLDWHYFGKHSDPYTRLISPHRSWWYEGSGNATAGLSNDDYELLSAADSATIPVINSRFAGSAWHFFASTRADTTNGTVVSTPFVLTPSGYTRGKAVNIAVDTTSYKFNYYGAVDIDNKIINNVTTWTAQPVLDWVHASIAARLDFAFVINGTLTRIKQVSPEQYPTGSGVGALAAEIWFQGLDGDSDSATNGLAVEGGQVLELDPGRYNLIQSAGLTSGNAYIPGYAFLYQSVEITPRWSLL